MPSHNTNESEDLVKVMWDGDHSKTKMFEFMQTVNKKFHLQLDNYDELWNWSVTCYKEFWQEVWLFCSIISSEPFHTVVDSEQEITSIPKWFEGAKLNYAQNLLRYKDDQIALISTGEGRQVMKMTYKELYHQVSLVASALKHHGVGINDRIAGYIPNCMECVIVMLACASIGAIWSSTSPDFGVKGVLDRFDQIKPKILFSVNAVRYNGKVHSHWSKVEQVTDQLSDIELVVVIPFVTESEEDFKDNLNSITKSVSWDDFVNVGKTNADGLHFEQLTFHHPLFIMYSSGTTGKPKCMVHSAGGTLIQHAKEHTLHGDLRRDDVFIYYTTTGWMMWNWLIGSLITGCTVVLYDGSPFQPTSMVLWDYVDLLNITVLGVSAKCLAVMEEKQQTPITTHKLASLRTILSTGSPLASHQYDYVYNKIKNHVLLASITGGTDIISCFAGHNCMKAVVRGEVQSANLGMSIACYNDNGIEVYDEPGELVCVKPFPCMPTHFWKDEEQVLYKKAYFNKFPGVWSHGDYCMQSSITKGWKFLGRSDATLNPNGIRIGTSEIYSIIENTFGEDIVDSVAAAYRPSVSEEQMVLFVVMQENKQLNLKLEKEIRSSIRSHLSPRHVPSIIKSVADIPYTISGKKVEVAVTKMLSGHAVQHRSAFRNPQSLDLYKNIIESKD